VYLSIVESQEVSNRETSVSHFETEAIILSQHGHRRDISRSMSHHDLGISICAQRRRRPPCEWNHFEQIGFISPYL